MTVPAFDAIETPRLRMRRYRSDDFELMHRVMSDERVMRHYVAPFTREQSQRALFSALDSYERFGYSLLAIEKKAGGEFIGHAGLLHWDDVDGRDDVEVAYMLLPAFWGFGYATEAAHAAKSWAFEYLAPDRVVSFIVAENEPSIKVAERNGMSRLKRLEENRFGRPIYVYGVTAATWTGERERRS